MLMLSQDVQGPLKDHHFIFYNRWHKRKSKLSCWKIQFNIQVQIQSKIDWTLNHVKMVRLPDIKEQIQTSFIMHKTYETWKITVPILLSWLPCYQLACHSNHSYRWRYELVSFLDCWEPAITNSVYQRTTTFWSDHQMSINTYNYIKVIENLLLFAKFIVSHGKKWKQKFSLYSLHYQLYAAFYRYS